MDKLKMHTPSLADEHFAALAALFPNAVTETIDENGAVVRAIDKDVLMQEISAHVVEGREERYQFTWPDKKKSVLLANAPIAAALRPCREESVNFDTTENLYIEGDNLDVLKLLRETYLGRVKMIYIDPPYNTGHDFVYEDDFADDADSFLRRDGQYDEQGNRLSPNLDSNGRFHTDWLNMMYTRLRIARDLLSEDGAIFIHIDENEIKNIQNICSEIFGEVNELGTIVWDKRNPKGAVVGVAYQHESIVIYCKSKVSFASVPFTKPKENAEIMIKIVEQLIRREGKVNAIVREQFKKWIKEHKTELSGGESAYALIDDNGRIYQPVSMAAPDKPETRSHRPLVHPLTGKDCPVPEKGWRFTDKKMDELVSLGKIEYGNDETTQPRQKYYLDENMDEAISSLIYYGGNADTLGLPFDNPKPLYISMKIINSICKGRGEIVMDFFSGSATTAHAVMQLNAEDGGHRKFIMIQLPEICADDSEAVKAGYKNICEIGKERIRRAGAKIKADSPLTTAGLDIGFRVLKLDSSNMKDVYYTPEEYAQLGFSLDGFMDNIKEDRSPEDLLFQVMLDLGIPLSAKITQDGDVFYVNDNYLIACFKQVDTELITEIAQKKPYYAVFRDSSFTSDSAMVNFEQVFNTYSPNTIRRVL